MHEQVLAEIEGRGLIRAAQHPRLTARLRHYASQGRLGRVLGDVYALPEAVSSFDVRVAAARLVHPNCVFTGETAAKLSWWTDLETDLVTAAGSVRRSRSGITLERRSIPDKLKHWDGTHFLTSPALSVLDLTDTRGGYAIDEALRRSVVSIEDLRTALALTSNRPGNAARARLVHESRDEPWSPLEREAHVLLRRAHLTGWVTNHRVVIEGSTYFIDVAMPREKLAVEIHGWKYHRTRESLDSDVMKWNDLTADGWTLLHFTTANLGEIATRMRSELQRLRRLH